MASDKKKSGGSHFDTDFYKHWFAGINCFLETASSESINEFLCECARSCSSSFSREVYILAFSGDRALSEGLEELHRAFEDFDYTVFDDHIEIRYATCGCDLVNEGHISSSRLCLCSELSMWDNFKAVGTEPEKIIRKGSILHGDSRCCFEVYFKKKERE